MRQLLFTHKKVPCAVIWVAIYYYLLSISCATLKYRGYKKNYYLPQESSLFQLIFCLTLKEAPWWERSTREPSWPPSGGCWVTWPPCSSLGIDATSWTLPGTGKNKSWYALQLLYDQIDQQEKKSLAIKPFFPRCANALSKINPSQVDDASVHHKLFRFD